MKAHPFYQIIHLRLDQADEMPQRENPDQGCYLVFWWKTIPLGELYLEPGTPLTETSYFKKRHEAVLAALTAYAGSKEQAVAFIPENSTLFPDLEPEQLRHYTTLEIPASVPVSVIVCTRNRAPALNCCLHMLTSLTCRPAEIVVIDNAPDDESSRKVTEKFSDLNYIKEPRAGLDIARNTGIREAKYPIVAFTDDDVSVHPLWVYNVWKSFQDPDTAAMTGLVIAAELATEAQYIFEKHWSFNRGYKSMLYDKAFFRKTLRKGPPVWKIGAGANMAFRREIFEKVGLFDELLDVGAAGCSGDSEMWYRILKSGHSIYYNPRAIVFHEHRRELEALKKQIFHYMRGHAAAALTQQKQYRQAGYIRHLARTLLIAYSQSVVKGFPQYQMQYKTIWVQIAGMLSGVAYYLKNKRKNNLTNLN